MALSNETKKFLRPYVGTRDNQDKPFHPNRISAYGGLFAFAGYGCLASPVTAPASLILLGASFGCDVADGYVARNFDLSSKQGAKLDPLFDKVKNVGFVGTAGLLGSLSNPYLLAGSVLSLGVDYVSQKQRGSISKQIDEAYDVILDPNRSVLDELEDLETKLELENLNQKKSENLKANWFGKTKTGLQTVVHLGYAGMISAHNLIDFDNTYYETGLGVLLGASALCGAVGVYQRMKKSNN